MEMAVRLDTGSDRANGEPMQANRRFGVVGGKPDNMNRQTWFVRDTVTGTHVEGPYCSIGLALSVCRELNEETSSPEWVDRMRDNDHA